MTRHLHPLAALSALAIPLAMGSPGALAQTSPWSVRTGPVAVLFDASSSVAVAGATVPGGTVAVKDNTTLGLEVGYAFSSDLTARFAFGVPPTTTLSADGSLKGLVPPLTGTLGKIRYAPAVLSLTHAFGPVGGVRPYLGAGINYTAVLKERDGDVAGLRVKDAFGPVLEAGVDVPLQNGWSLFLDVRKVFVKVKATGTLPAVGGPPATANVKLNPVLVHAGLGYRF